VGIALAPIAGGWLLERFRWGSIFLFFVPAAAVSALLVASRVPASRDPRTPPVDWRGFALSAAGMGLLVYGIIQMPGRGWARRSARRSARSDSIRSSPPAPHAPSSRR
jgi:MFS family permease